MRYRGWEGWLKTSKVGTFLWESPKPGPWALFELNGETEQDLEGVGARSFRRLGDLG